MLLSDQALVEALAAIGVQAPVRFEEVTDSTQTVALGFAEGGAPEWTIVAAGHQTGGRGRLGRTWVDEPGRSLMFSLVLRPEALEPARGGLLALLAGAAMALACRDVAGVPAACKWPNDLVLGLEKVGGIIAESRLTGARFAHVVLGVGVNLEPPAGVERAVGLGDVDPAPLLAAFLGGLHERYRPGHDGFARVVLDAYVPLCATLGARVRATTTGGAEVLGLAVDVDAEGGLVVETASGARETVRFGEVEHLTPEG